MTPSVSPALILASTSRYRNELLQRLRIPFRAVPPEVDESPRPQERPSQLAQRLALAKSRAVARMHPDAVVIGSDQVADLHGQCLGKPGHHAAAVAMLQAMRGQTVRFHTALALTQASTGKELQDMACVEVVFRKLTDDEIEQYLTTEQPYDCAGSAKSEGLGIALLDRIDSDDPTALIGLPLIRTARMLRSFGLNPLARPTVERP